jgi:hypothetical protein
MNDNQSKNEQKPASDNLYPEKELYPNRKAHKNPILQRDDRKELKESPKITWVGILLAAIVIGLMVYNSYMDKQIRDEAKASESRIVETEPLSDAEAAELAYKESCEDISYEELTTNPDEHEGKLVKLTGEVVEVLEDTPKKGYFTYGINVTKGEISWGDSVYVTFDVPSATEAYAKDWNLTFYGEYMGLIDYEAEVGGKLTLPWVDAEYLDRN